MVELSTNIFSAFYYLRVSLLQPTSPKFQDFAEQVKERALADYNYTFGENEEVISVHSSGYYFSLLLYKVE